MPIGASGSTVKPAPPASVSAPSKPAAKRRPRSARSTATIIVTAIAN